MRRFYLTTRYAAALVSCLFFCMGAIAQPVIKGTVTNANGQTLSGASVVVQEGKKGTTTDINGFYSVQTTPGKHIVLAQKSH